MDRKRGFTPIELLVAAIAPGIAFGPQYREEKLSSNLFLYAKSPNHPMWAFLHILTGKTTGACTE